MLESQGRLAIGKDLFFKVDIKENEKINIFFDNEKKALVLLPCDDFMRASRLYFIATHSIDSKCRIFIPSQVRDAFPGATYLPTEKDGIIYIFIFEHQKKPE